MNGNGSLPDGDGMEFLCNGRIVVAIWDISVEVRSLKFEACKQLTLREVDYPGRRRCRPD